MNKLQTEYLEKYASYADSLLAEEHGSDYTVEDVEKLASALIESDLEKAAEVEHVEYLVKCAQVQARAFADEIIKIAVSPDLINRAASSVLKKGKKSEKKVMEQVKRMQKSRRGKQPSKAPKKDVPKKDTTESWLTAKKDVKKYIKKNPFKAVGGAGALGLGAGLMED